MQTFPFFSIFLFDPHTLQNETGPEELTNLYADSEKSSTSLPVQWYVGYLSWEIRNVMGLILAQAELCHNNFRFYGDDIQIDSIPPQFLKSFEQLSKCYFVLMVEY